jgi:hypothetical protein
MENLMYVTMRVGTLLRLIAGVALVTAMVLVLLMRTPQEPRSESPADVRATCTATCAEQVNVD